MREQQPRILSPLDLAEAKLPQNVKLFLSYERGSHNPRLPEDFRSGMADNAKRIMSNLFSPMDYRSLTEFSAFETDYRATKQTKLDDMLGKNTIPVEHVLADHI